MRNAQLKAYAAGFLFLRRVLCLKWKMIKYVFLKRDVVVTVNCFSALSFRSPEFK